LIGVLFPRRLPPGETPSVLVLVAARDEEASLPAFLAALDRLDYPAGRLAFGLISDGSSDRTPETMTAWADGRSNARSLVIEKSVGKAAALRLAMAQAPPSELVVTYDADGPPRPDSLRLLVAPFADPKVGLAGGRCAPANPEVSLVSRYSALEHWVHHLVNLAGKDRWNLGPIPSGIHAAYRRSALESIGGFEPGLADDVPTALRLMAAGWRARYVVDACVDTRVVTATGDFVRQRRRWSSNLRSAARCGRGIEPLVVAAGYLDRLVLAAGVGLAIAGTTPPALVAAYLSTVLASVILAIARAGYARSIPAFLWSAAAMLPLELWVSFGALGGRSAGDWTAPGREAVRREEGRRPSGSP
jgi:GT2 family glycosyltransferase